jgi:hypothetical protein
MAVSLPREPGDPGVIWDENSATVRRSPRFVVDTVLVLQEAGKGRVAKSEQMANFLCVSEAVPLGVLRIGDGNMRKRGSLCL